MILTRGTILNLIKRGKIVIEPFDPNSVGPASIDLSLGDKIRVFKEGTKTIHMTEDSDFLQHTREVDITNGYDLKPGEFILGMTLEKITLPDNVCGWIHSRSRFARFGLMSHATAPFIQPGVSNRTVLEIYHLEKHKLRIFPGLRICQLILQKCKGKAKYEGKYKDQ
jgi:dCTP deaminase